MKLYWKLNNKSNKIIINIKNNTIKLMINCLSKTRIILLLKIIHNNKLINKNYINNYYINNRPNKYKQIHKLINLLILIRINLVIKLHCCYLKRKTLFHQGNYKNLNLIVNLIKHNKLKLINNQQKQS